MKTNWTVYVEKELRDGAIDIEYDGFLKNLHSTKTFYVKIRIENTTDQAQEEVIILPPLSEKKVMSHQAGPCLGNDLDFEIVKVYAQKPK